MLPCFSCKKGKNTKLTIRVVESGVIIGHIASRGGSLENNGNKIMTRRPFSTKLGTTTIFGM